MNGLAGFYRMTLEMILKFPNPDIQAKLIMKLVKNCLDMVKKAESNE